MVDAIVEATARILERDAHDTLTTNAVAELAGVSIGSLYQYFPDKGALIGALIVRETSLLVDDAAAAAAAAPSGSLGLKRLIGAAVRHQLRRPALARVLDFEEGRMPFDAHTQRVRSRFRTILVGLLARPDLSPQPDLATATSDVASIIQGMSDAAGVRGEEDQAELAKRVERAVFGYLGSPR